MTCILLFHWIMLHIVGTLSQNVVRGVVGQAVTLPCTYNVRWQSDLTDMCWGRGSCPNSKCSNEILRTNGRRVTSKKSQRYQLKGYVTRGDVSLTIANLNEGDKGLYCCRVEIKGWFNDIKKTLNLQVERATTITTTTTTMTTTSQMTTTTLAATSLTTISSVPPTFPLTTKSAFPTTSNATSGLMLPTPSLPPTTTAPSFLFTTKSASPITLTATDHLTPSTSSMPTAIIVTTTIPSFLLTTKPGSIRNPSATDDLTLPKSSVSTVIAFLTTDTRLENIKSLPTNFQYDSIKNDFGTTEADAPTTGQTVLDFSKKYYPVLIPCALVICVFSLIPVLWQIKCKKRGKYELDKVKSLDEQEEPEQEPTGTEEDGLFPL